MDLLEWEDYLVHHEGELFTGIAYELRPDGSPWSEVSYTRGLEDGPAREWYEDGTLQSESTSKLGVTHGVSKEWHPNGRLRSEKVVELGYRVSEKEWDEQGRLVKETRVDEGSEYFAELVAAREREPRRVARIREKLGRPTSS